MLKDVEIKQLSNDVDDILAGLALKYNISALSLAAVVNARLIWANREGGSEDDYKKLLQSIIGMPVEEHFTSFGMH